MQRGKESCQNWPKPVKSAEELCEGPRCVTGSKDSRITQSVYMRGTLEWAILRGLCKQARWRLKPLGTVGTSLQIVVSNCLAPPPFFQRSPAYPDPLDPEIKLVGSDRSLLQDLHTPLHQVLIQKLPNTLESGPHIFDPQKARLPTTGSRLIDEAAAQVRWAVASLLVGLDALGQDLLDFGGSLQTIKSLPRRNRLQNPCELLSMHMKAQIIRIPVRPVIGGGGYYPPLLLENIYIYVYIYAYIGVYIYICI